MHVVIKFTQLALLMASLKITLGGLGRMGNAVHVVNAHLCHGTKSCTVGFILIQQSNALLSLIHASPPNYYRFDTEGKAKTCLMNSSSESLLTAYPEGQTLIYNPLKDEGRPNDEDDLAINVDTLQVLNNLGPVRWFPAKR